MDADEAAWVAESWPGGRGLVPRGPRWLLGYAPADPAEVERHTGRRPSSEVWRVDVGGRFLRSGGLVYPGGVPFPDELARKTAVVSSEVWLYVEESTSRVVGMHSWPEAVRRPVASVPREDFPADAVRHPDDARLGFTLRIPSHADWDAAAVVCRPDEAVVILVRQTVPDPLNEMLLFEQGGLSLRESTGDRPDLAAILRDHQPPFRRTRVGRTEAIGRDPGRALGPQTWPWPGELLWWEGGIRFELKGFAQLATLEAVARTL
jgi:hypothetical protein